MIFNTKFSPGDTVWIMEYNRPVIKKVYRVTAISSTGKCISGNIFYNMGDSKVDVSENQCFSSLNELLDNLKQNV